MTGLVDRPRGRTKYPMRDTVLFTRSDFHWGIYMPAVRKWTAAIWFGVPRQVQWQYRALKQLELRE
jgi:hypothetical protein